MMGYGRADRGYIGHIAGIDIHVSPDVPRYELPAEVIPGVPWPPGFRDEINKWSRDFLGTRNLLPDRAMMISSLYGFGVVNPRGAVMLSNIAT